MSEAACVPGLVTTGVSTVAGAMASGETTSVFVFVSVSARPGAGAAVRDGALGEMILDLGERTIPVRRLVAPSTLTRLGRTKLSGKAAIH